MNRDIVAEGVAALRLFGHDLDRTDAARLLGMWHYADRLTPAEHAGILANFPAAPTLAEILRLLQQIDRKITDALNRESAK